MINCNSITRGLQAYWVYSLVSTTESVVPYTLSLIGIYFWPTKAYGTITRIFLGCWSWYSPRQTLITTGKHSRVVIYILSVHINIIKLYRNKIVYNIHTIRTLYCLKGPWTDCWEKFRWTRHPRFLVGTICCLKYSFLSCTSWPA